MEYNVGYCNVPFSCPCYDYCQTLSIPDFANVTINACPLMEIFYCKLLATNATNELSFINSNIRLKLLSSQNEWLD